MPKRKRTSILFLCRAGGQSGEARPETSWLSLKHLNNRRPIPSSIAEQRRCVRRLRTAVPCRAVRCCLHLQGAPPLAGSRQVFYSWCIHQLTHSCSSRPAGRRRRRRRTMRTATSWPMAARNRPAGRAHASAARGRRTLQRPLVALRCNCKQTVRSRSQAGLAYSCFGCPCWPSRSPMHVWCFLVCWCVWL